MELCIKTILDCQRPLQLSVSILVLMELCIKTPDKYIFIGEIENSFNPCFNGTMYKN